MDDLARPAEWARFRESKAHNGQLSRAELQELDDFIAAAGYGPVVACMRADVAGAGGSGSAGAAGAGGSVRGELAFGYPKRMVVNKSGTRKKRVVYSYDATQTWVLKVLAFLLYRYDGKLSDACYSFRRQLSAKTAWERIMALPDAGRMWVLKADIHDYFNSMPVERLMETLGDFVDDDPELLAFLRALHLDECCWEGDELVVARRGAMAGVPTSAFMANIYLDDVDRNFLEQGVPYFRYSDDILIFARSESELLRLRDELEAAVGEHGLEMNPAKTAVFAPGEAWDFLGFRYVDGRIDLSRATVRKMKDRIKRKAHALYRWRMSKGVDFERTARVMIRVFDRKIYDFSGTREFTWARWFFPVLSCSDGLHEIDECMVEHLRYLSSGRYYKGNYRVGYEQLKALGYTSLVHEYYRYLEDCRMLDEFNAGVAEGAGLGTGAGAGAAGAAGAGAAGAAGAAGVTDVE